MASFEEPVTIKITSEKGVEVTVSALFERDPQFLHWNRIAILGSEADELQMMQLHEGLLRWEVYRRADWAGCDPMDVPRENGTGWLRSSGVMAGISIAPESIQRVSELQIFEATQTFAHGQTDGQGIECLFLQRPQNWPVYSRSFAPTEPRKVYGRWKQTEDSGLRFRLMSVGHLREDRRISDEVEKVILPGVQIRRVGNALPTEEFSRRVDDLWFCVRAVLTFGLRQPITPLAEFRESEGVHTSKWHTVELKPRSPRADQFDPVLYPRLDSFLGRATASIYKIRQYTSLMHAASYGYAISFHSDIMESGLTSCVEGLERLVTAFEATRNLDQDLATPREWKPVAKSLKEHVSTLAIDRKMERRIKRSLSFPPKLSLQERLERMVVHFRRYLSSSDRVLFSGIDRMIKVRNDIVHGRLIEDINTTYVELLRARAVFERLFLCFLRCGSTQSSAYPQLVISQHYGRSDPRH